MRWQQYFKQELEDPTREEIYLAQIASEVRRTIAKSPNSVRLRQFLIPFKAESGGMRPPPITAEDLETRTAMSKAFWFGILGKSQPPPKKG